MEVLYYFTVHGDSIYIRNWKDYVLMYAYFRLYVASQF